MSVQGLFGLPEWDRAAADDLVGAVSGLRCAIGDMLHRLAQAEATAREHWTGPNRSAFDLRCAEIRRLLEALDAELGVIGARVEEGAESLDGLRRSLLLLAEAVATGGAVGATLRR